MKTVFPIVALLLLGCFQAPSLPPCAPDGDCPVELPVCREGICFHYSVDYATPLCHDSGGAGNCCQLTSGEGCLEDTTPHTVLVSGFDAGIPIAAGADGSWYYYDVDANGWRSAEPLAISQPFGLAMTGMGRCLLGPGTVGCCSAAAGPCVTLQTDVATSGLAALCKDGIARFASPDGVIQLGQESEKLLEVAIGELPDHLGPVVHVPTNSVAVPVDSGAAVALFQQGELVREIPSKQLPDGVLGLALDEATLYVAATGGRLVAVGLGAGLRYDHDWQTPEFHEGWLAGPVVTGYGEVVVATDKGELLFISKSNRSAPQRILEEGLALELVALHGGAVAALVSSPAGVITSRMPRNVLPGLPSDGDFVNVTLPLDDCTPRGLSLGGEDGRMLIQCQQALVLAVSAAPVDVASPWPQNRGWGGSGCFE